MVDTNLRYVRVLFYDKKYVRTYLTGECPKLLYDFKTAGKRKEIPLLFVNGALAVLTTDLAQNNSSLLHHYRDSMPTDYTK